MEVDPEENRRAAGDAAMLVREHRHVGLQRHLGRAGLGTAPRLLAQVVGGGAVEDLAEAKEGVGGDRHIGALRVASLEAEVRREAGVHDDLLATNRQLRSRLDEGKDLMNRRTTASRELHLAPTEARLAISTGTRKAALRLAFTIGRSKVRFRAEARKSSLVRQSSGKSPSSAQGWANSRRPQSPLTA